MDGQRHGSFSSACTNIGDTSTKLSVLFFLSSFCSFLTPVLEYITPAGNRGSFVRRSFAGWLYRILSGKATQFEVFRASRNRNLRLSSPWRHGTQAVSVEIGVNAKLLGSRQFVGNQKLVVFVVVIRMDRPANEIHGNRIASFVRFVDASSFKATVLFHPLRRLVAFRLYLRSIHGRFGNFEWNRSGNDRETFFWDGEEGRIDGCLSLRSWDLGDAGIFLHSRGKVECWLRDKWFIDIYMFGYICIGSLVSHCHFFKQLWKVTWEIFNGYL